MRRPPAISSAPMKLQYALAHGLRAEFADTVSAPLTDELAALMRRLSGDHRRHSGKGRDNGPSASKTSGRVDRRG
jgi:hypothetical protein